MNATIAMAAKVEQRLRPFLSFVALPVEVEWEAHAHGDRHRALAACNRTGGSMGPQGRELLSDGPQRLLQTVAVDALLAKPSN
mmetsp:Transcript_13450/g.36217  ORF Transcript_13450/g.36217 Transcript_13450/m.36217 type:complete len:83 (+) Transcript_13450:92-340(+)